MADERRGYNHLSVAVYNAYTGTTPITDPDGALEQAEVVRLTKFYPGGLYGAVELFIPREARRVLPFIVGNRLVVRNGNVTVWAGVVNEISLTLRYGVQGFRVTGDGYWGDLLGKRGINKPWADNRLSEAAWIYQPITVYAGSEKATIDRLNRIQFTPKAVSWANEAAAVRYTAPTGQTVKRVTLTFDLQEAAQDWALDIYDPVGASTIGSQITTSGSGTMDETLGTPRQSVELRLISNTTQTPAADGSQYAKFSGVTVYTETGAIDLTQIATDVASALSDLSTDTSTIASNTYSLAPFITENYEMYSSVLERAWGFGDSSQNAWAAFVDDVASSGKPRLNVEQQPALTDFDYQLALEELTLVGGIQIVRSRAELYNWIVVTYRDELDNREVVVTPDDNSALKDTTSITDYGQRETKLSLGLTTSAAAVNAGARFLARHKDPVYYVSGPLTVQGYIREKNGTPVAASEIQPGKRVKLIDFVPDLVGVSGAGLTQIITGVDYLDGEETAQLSLGVPDDLAVLLAQLAHFNDRSVV